MPSVGRKRKSGHRLPRRVYQRSGTFWYVDYQGKWHKLGRTEQEMHAGLAKILGATESNISTVIARYRAEVLPEKAPNTQAAQRSQLDRLEKVFGKCHPSRIRPSEVAKYLDVHPHPVAANREIALLSHIFKKAIRWGLCESNPCVGVERNREKPRDRYVTDGEFWAVHEKAPKHVQLMMELAYVTG